MIPKMDVIKVEEAGYESALFGLSLNKNKNPDEMISVARKLCDKDYGHNKFLESIMVWLSVTAPRYWWQEADTYRMSTKQSESTMHTLIKSFQGNFLHSDINKHFESDLDFGTIDKIIEYVTDNKLTELKSILPEGFIQKRMWCMSYKTLRNIIIQRYTHRLPHLKLFCDSVLVQVDHPELLRRKEDVCL